MTIKPFLMNAWYVGALKNELSSQPLGRVICNEPVVFFRGSSGDLIALEDRCCHKNYPLHLGRVEGDRLRCGYHGFLYSSDGACVEIPGQARIPPSARVRTYPVVERSGLIWIWMGDTALADPKEITDFHWLDDPQWGAKSTRFHVKASYRLIIENLLDLTHLAFVHGSTIGNRAVVDDADVTFERNDHEVKVTRWMMNVEPPASYTKTLDFGGSIDRWMVVHYSPPAFCRLYTGGAPTAFNARTEDAAWFMGWRNLNAMTPETETTTHYFWGQAHNHDVGDPAVTDFIFDQIHTAFLEDKDVFEAQQAMISAYPERASKNVYSLADAGGLHGIRILDRLLAEEAADPSAMVKPSSLRWGPFHDRT